MKRISMNDSGLTDTIRKVIFTLILLLVGLAVSWPNAFYADTSGIIIFEDSSRHYNNLGRECQTNGNYELAEYYFKKSLGIKQVYLSHDLRKIASGYLNLGANYFNMWRFDEALANYNKAEEIYAENTSNFQTELGILATNKGLLLLKIGEYHNANFHFEMALKYFAFSNDKHINIYRTHLLNSLGTVSIRLKEFNKAISLLNECVSLSIQYNPDMVSVAYGNLAFVYNEMKGYSDKAENYYQKTIDYYKNKYEITHYRLVGLYNNYADFLVKEKQYLKSKEYYFKSLHIAKANHINLHPSLSSIFLGLGDIFLATTKPDSALYYYQKSIAVLVPGFDDSDIYASPDIEKTISKIHLLKCLKRRAAAYNQKFSITRSLIDLKAALNSYDIAGRLIDLIRLGYQDQDSKLYLSENEKSTYHEALCTAQKLFRLTSDSYYLNKAFEYSERGKSSLLLAAIRDAGAKGFGGIPEELLKTEKELVRDIAFYKEQIYEELRKTEPERAKLDLWEKTLFDLTNQNNRLIVQFEKEYPKYHTLKYNSGVTGISKVEGELPVDCSLLQYTLTDSLLYIFVVGRKHTEIITKPVDSVFFQTFSVLLKSVKHVDFTNHTQNDFLSFCHAAATMHKYLIEPALPFIQGRHLIIIPDDILSFLPFEILLADNDEHYVNIMDYRKLDYLIRKYSISYAYSSTMLFENQWNVKKKARKGLLAFAPVYHGKDTSAMRGNSRSAYRKNLAPIPGAKEEVEKIVKITGGEAFLNDHATELKFKASCSDFDVLHLAMHTIIDDDNPMFSKLVFSVSNDASEDGFLNTHEIFNLNLSARLAILSSCSSGEGLLKSGEGVVSLARGFAYAGCPGLLMTLWALEDKTGIEMMVGFYKNLKLGYRRDVALQKAKIDFIESGNHIMAHPFYWSSYISIGDQSALYHPKRKYAAIFLSLAVIVILIFVVRKSCKRSC
ncbi:MAG: CHAT domain-containing tetratricopeptide repeat protein [Bacteroidales bacterium]